ncbi:DUF4998 domain-containing protein [Niabella sp. CC-SYL272]|uniref:DUF4998 domain-containing protein n=1 Tax=Niabella agricola TaxID=2891571 RepID=UPI001F2EFDD8|nr:DUF4998 domain-containing protein [Niabella agricola]MCF3111808.1 DUF4998 domain-containing protein [Niabella agricola]
MKFFISVFILSLILVTGCEKDQYAYKKFIGNSEIVYAGLAQEIGTRSGNLRIQMEWKKSIDPTVVSYTVYWNNNRDSATIPATAIHADGVYRYIVSGLPEYVQSFKMVTTNDRGDRSIGQAINGVRVFGPYYRSSLTNQRLSSRKFFGTDSVRLYFLKTDTTKIFSQIRYTRKDGVLDSVRFKQDSVTISSYLPGSKPALQSYYLPMATAIDTFKTLAADSLTAF